MLPNLFNIVMAPLLRAFFTLVGTTTGVWVRFEQVRGDLFSYKAHLDGVELDISDQLKCSVKTCSLQFSLLDFSLETLVVSNVYLEGARLEYTHAPKQNLLPRNMPPFLIRNLTIKDSEVIFRDNSRRSPFVINMQIDDYYCEALHSQYLLFNAIFSSHMEGKLGSTPFSVLFKKDEPQYTSKWIITGLPMRLVSPFVDSRLKLIEQSSMNLLIQNEWNPDSEAMTMLVHVLVTDLVNFKLPRALPEGTKKFGEAIKVFINHQAKEIPLSFQFELSKNDFLDLKDIDTVAILTVFGEALTQALMEKSLKNYDQIWDMGMLGLDTIMDIKKLFDKY